MAQNRNQHSRWAGLMKLIELLIKAIISLFNIILKPTNLYYWGYGGWILWLFEKQTKLEVTDPCIITAIVSILYECSLCQTKNKSEEVTNWSAMLHQNTIQLPWFCSLFKAYISTHQLQVKLLLILYSLQDRSQELENYNPIMH